MKLTLTHYVDSEPHTVERDLPRVLGVALDAAAARADVDRTATLTEAIDGGLRVIGGIDVLDGSEIRVTGTHRLTTLEVVVPWSSADVDGAKLWAANRFASTLADEVLPAA